MYSYIANFASQMVAKALPSKSTVTDGVLLIHEDGSVKLNLENKEVQNKIRQQLAELSRIPTHEQTQKNVATDDHYLPSA